MSHGDAKQIDHQEALGSSINLPEPDEIAEDIVKDLESALEEFRSVVVELEQKD